MQEKGHDEVSPGTQDGVTAQVEFTEGHFASTLFDHLTLPSSVSDCSNGASRGASLQNAADVHFHLSLYPGPIHQMEGGCWQHR